MIRAQSRRHRLAKDLIGAFIIGCAAFARSAWALPDDAAVRALLDERIAQKRGIGFAVVLLDGKGTRVLTVGSVRAGGAPIAADTEFEIGSITKTFTTLLLADLVVRGDARLDDPITKYLPDATGLARDGKTVSLQQLATHTSGLPRLPNNLAPAKPADPYADYDAARLTAFLSGNVLGSGSAPRYEYSNVGVGLLGYALTVREGGYEKVLRERVLSPLRMTDTAIVLSGAQQQRFATGHGVQLAPVSPWRFDALAGAGALRSTAADMAKYLKAATLFDTPGLSAAFALAESPLVDGPSPALRVGLAWQVLTRSDRTIVWHNGQTGGFASMIAFDPRSKEGVVVLSNASISVDDLALHMLDESVALWPPPKQHSVAKVDASIFDRIAGRYELLRGFVITIRRDGDRVFAQATGQAELEIFPESAYEYFYQAVDAQMSFKRNGDRVSGLVLHQGGRDINARRID